MPRIRGGTVSTSLMVLLESYIEQKFSIYVDSKGGATVKIASARGWPDRVVITHTGKIYFLEMKRPEGNLAKYQKYIHSILRRLGQNVRTAYDFEEAVSQYKEICS